MSKIIINKSLINPFKNNWLSLDSTNCYAYALGIDIPVEDLGIKGYRPGFTTGDENNEIYDDTLLLDQIVKDLDNLKIDFRYVNQFYKIDNNEWKIAIFGGSKYSDKYYDDYHFLRQTKDTIWTHKQGYFCEPTNLDSDKKIIQLPKTCNIDSDTIKYNYIMTLCLKK